MKKILLSAILLVPNFILTQPVSFYLDNKKDKIVIWSGDNHITSEMKSNPMQVFAYNYDKNTLAPMILNFVNSLSNSTDNIDLVLEQTNIKSKNETFKKYYDMGADCDTLSHLMNKGLQPKVGNLTIKNADIRPKPFYFILQTLETIESLISKPHNFAFVDECQSMTFSNYKKMLRELYNENHESIIKNSTDLTPISKNKIDKFLKNFEKLINEFEQNDIIKTLNELFPKQLTKKEIKLRFFLRCLDTISRNKTGLTEDLKEDLAELQINPTIFFKGLLAKKSTINCRNIFQLGKSVGYTLADIGFLKATLESLVENRVTFVYLGDAHIQNVRNLIASDFETIINNPWAINSITAITDTSSILNNPIGTFLMDAKILNGHLEKAKNLVLRISDVSTTSITSSSSSSSSSSSLRSTSSLSSSSSTSTSLSSSSSTLSENKESSSTVNKPSPDTSSSSSSTSITPTTKAESISKIEKEKCVKCFKEDTNENPLKKCSRCKIAKYCSADCQKADWKNHKKCCQSTST